MMVVGECINLINGFVCSCGKYQNYPCPYRNDINKCKSSMLVTEDIKRQWEEKGVVIITNKDFYKDLLMEQQEQM